MFKTIVIAAIAALTTETQAVQIKSQAEIDAVVQNYLQAEEGSEAEWGFLKNIVNIDNKTLTQSSLEIIPAKRTSKV